MFGLIPREEAFFELFKNAAHNMIEGSRLLKEPDAVAGWIRPDALFGIQAIVEECQGAAEVALTQWHRQLAIEGASDLFGQGAQARLRIRPGQPAA